MHMQPDGFLSDHDMYYESILRLVKQAGSIVREAFNHSVPVHVMLKSSAVDLVTATDREVEKFLFDGLKNEFSDHKFIGEESSEGKNCLTDAPTWIIDPIDGTTNFVHKLPFVCISVGLFIDKKPNIGIVYNPITDELFSARAGQGAYRNGFRMYASGTKSLSQSVIFHSWGIHNLKEYPQSLNIYIENSKRFVERGIQGHRSLGSAALNMAYVANGSSDAYVEYGLHCWDMAAAALLITEAGGCVMDPTGAPFDVMSRRVLCAGSKELAKEISSILTHVPVARDD